MRPILPCRIAAGMLALLAAAWPGLGNAARLPPEGGGPPVGTTVSGFTQVLGPNAATPEDAGEFPNQPGVPAPPASRSAAAPAPGATPPAQH